MSDHYWEADIGNGELARGDDTMPPSGIRKKMRSFAVQVFCLDGKCMEFKVILGKGERPIFMRRSRKTVRVTYTDKTCTKEKKAEELGYEWEYIIGKRIPIQPKLRKRFFGSKPTGSIKSVVIVGTRTGVVEVANEDKKPEELYL